MKIAGRKNNGAWFRANKVIHNLSETEQGDLTAYLEDALSEVKDDAYNAVLALLAEAGVTPPASPSTANAWISRMVLVGIPLQIWMGRLSFTTYSKTGEGESAVYTANYQTAIHNFGKRLRKAVTRWLMGRRQSRDIFDIGLQSEGNPGGQPDSVANN